MKRIGLRGTGGMRVGLYAFTIAWFCAVVLVTTIILRTSPASDTSGSDLFFCWLLLAGGALVSAAGFSTTWALALMDNRWVCSPLGPTRPDSRPGARNARVRPNSSHTGRG